MNEAELQKQCVKLLRILSSRSGFVFFAPMNEAAQMVAGGSSPKNRARIASYMRSMGALAGVADLVIVHGGRAYFIELKVDRNSQSSHQVEFEKRVIDTGCHYVVARSVDEVQTALRGWGIV